MLEIKVFIMDVDGVLCDGIYIAEDSHTGAQISMKKFNPKDGQGIKLLQSIGIQVAIISGRPSHAVEIRARELEIGEVHLGIKDKKRKLMQVLEELNWGKNDADHIKLEHVAYIGDDFGDLQVMNIVGLAIAPADASREAKMLATHVTEARGGEGVVREAAEYILEQMNQWSDVVAKWM